MHVLKKLAQAGSFLALAAAVVGGLLLYDKAVKPTLAKMSKSTAGS